jgi:signal transduction histidine kinase
MPPASTNFVRNSFALLLVGLVTLTVILGMSLVMLERTRSYSDALVEMPQIRRALLNVFGLVQDAESSQRGFLLTREPAYLEPYRTATATIDQNTTRLRELVRAEPEYAPAVDAMAQLIGAKLAELAETVELAQAGRMDEAMALVRSHRGERAMAELREATNSLLGSINARLDANAAVMSATVVRLTPILVAGGALILLVVSGATWLAWRHTRELERAREEVLDLNATLEERVRERAGDLARANEEIQRFAYIVSHDLRSPLVNVMGFTSELETGLAAIRAFMERVSANDDDLVVREARLAIDSDMPEAIGFIRSSTGKMDNLINAILRLSREGHRALTPERIDVADLMEAAADSVRHRLSEHGGEIAVEAPLPDISSDRLALEQIFGNLVDNAVKYLDPSRPGRIVIRGRETRTGVEYQVEDNGRGIAPEDHDRVFELFRRSGAQDVAGEGIGLSHVRALVRRLGGEITLQSSLGKGTMFRVRLPKNLLTLRESA